MLQSCSVLLRGDDDGRLVHHLKLGVYRLRVRLRVLVVVAEVHGRDACALVFHVNHYLLRGGYAA